MHRSNLRPLRTRRFKPAAGSAAPASAGPSDRAAAPRTISARRTLSALGAVWLAFAAASSVAGSPAENAPALTPAQAADARIVRGRYLVENVGLCADCHSPRDAQGRFIRDRWMLGAALPFQPTVPMPWSPAAPPLAGLPSLTGEQAVAFFRTGRRPDGTVPRPPMPEFRFDEADARAVVAYLKSLAP